MNQKIRNLLDNKGENYIFPFFWQRGEDEETLRLYMKVIHEANIGAVCVESRPHPDFCGPKWWQDMDVILDEAKNRGMKVWILDDSHFPTGYANGALKNKPDYLRKQSIYYREYFCREGEKLHISREELETARRIRQGACKSEEEIPDGWFKDDRLLGVYAFHAGDSWLDLKEFIRDGELNWTAPGAGWKVYAMHLTKNTGYRRNHINMMDAKSCRVLIDAAYEPHYAHYKEYFGTVIEGFFSDEPELGNGRLYDTYSYLGTDMDFPWSRELEEALKAKLGSDYPAKLALLWNNDADPDETARLRYTYMDQVTRLVAKDFSCQIGDWCRERGVKYIGHLIEDNFQHAQTASSLGHCFRGLWGQDMAGIDNIGGQVIPQGEDRNKDTDQVPQGEFFHYMLGKFASSYGALDPKKHGDSMCEIFGAYGWGAGVRLEKYLADHFLVRGINHYVPHAFSARPYPDYDCPPHFYAQGNNPQYRHFGELMKYMNRVCELIHGGVHIARTAVLYHGEGDWTGRAMPCYKAARKLYDAQIDYDYIPQDVFGEPDSWKTVIGEGMLKVNTQEYRVFCVPYSQYVTEALARAAVDMRDAGVCAVFIGGYPEGICNPSEDSGAHTAELLEELRKCPVVSPEDLAAFVRQQGGAEVSIWPANDRLRCYHYVHEDKTSVYMLVNEGTEDYCGTLELGQKGGCYLYNAWENCLETADYADGRLQICVEPRKSCIVIFDGAWDSAEVKAATKAVIKAGGDEKNFDGRWQRSVCRSRNYPAFGNTKEVTLPDRLWEEQPTFSGYVRYDNCFVAEAGEKLVLEITDAYEGVEVWVNGINLGIQIVPVYLYDISGAVKEGKNTVRIEVATTLEREQPDQTWVPETKSPTGINGVVKLWRK